MGKWKLFLAVLVPLVCLTGCWDSQDPEDLEYIITLGIDKGTEGYAFSMAPAKTQEKDPELVTATGRTLANAIANTNNKNSRRTDLGQLKMIILGRSLLEDGTMLQGVLDELGRSQDISGKVMVLGTGNSAQACIEELMKEDNGTGLFLWNFYKNTAKDVATTKGLDLETFYIELTEQQGGAILPCITPHAEGLRLNTGVALKDGAFDFVLEEKIERGYLFLLGEGEGAVLEGEVEESILPLRIVKSDVSYDFIQELDGRVRCIIQIKLKGDLLGMGEGAVSDFGETEKLEKVFVSLIKSEIQNTIRIAEEQDSPEIYGIAKRLRQEIPMFRGDFWKDVTIEIVPEIKIRDTGRIR